MKIITQNVQQSYIVGSERLRIAHMFIKFCTKNLYNHGFTNFPFSIFYEAPQNSRRQKADMKDPQILAAIIEKVLDTATWRPGFVHPCL